MKKILLILLTIALSFSAMAQNATTDKVIKQDASYYIYTGDSDDVTSSGDSTWSFTLSRVSAKQTYCSAYFEIDTLTGTSDTVYIYLQYSPTPNGIFINTDTVTFYQSADTSLIIQTAEAYNAMRWRTLIIGNKDEALIEIEKDEIVLYE